MTGPLLDSVARWLAGHGTRREMLRASAGAAVTLAATARIAPAVAAEAPPPIPSGSLDPWPVCSETRRFYCIESCTVDGVDQLAAAQPDFVPTVMATRDSVTAGEAERIEWWMFPALGDLQADDLDREVRLRFRSGLLEPVITYMQAADFSMDVSGSASTGWIIDVQGKPAVVPGTYELGSLEQADLIFVMFQGLARHRNSPQLPGWGGFEGFMAVDGVWSFSAPRWRGDGWNVLLESFHLLPDGMVNHGSYRAWISPPALERLTLTPGQAVGGALLISRIDNGVDSTVAATLSELHGGVVIDIPDLTFSSPTIAIHKRGKGGCAKKCRKGRRCKNGRCVKKKKHHKH